MIKIVNLQTGKEIVRDYTPEELAELQEIQVEQEAKQVEQAAREAARQSALDKLAALGLTPEEISAITGS